MRSGRAFPLVVCTLLALGVPSVTNASALHVIIEDRDDKASPGNLSAVFASGSGTIDVNGFAPFTIVQDGVGQLGQVDNHFEYFSVSGVLPAPGQSFTQNYNFFQDDAPTILSDTLAITITGHVATLADNTNVAVDLHFRSISLDGISPLALANATDLLEGQGLEPLFFPGHNSTYLRLLSAGGLQDFEVDVASGTPEPASMVLLASGAAILAYARARRKH